MIAYGLCLDLEYRAHIFPGNDATKPADDDDACFRKQAL